MDTAAYEYELIQRSSGQRAVIQVKTGAARVNLAELASAAGSNGHAFAYATGGGYDVHPLHLRGPGPAQRGHVRPEPPAAHDHRGSREVPDEERARRCVEHPRLERGVVEKARERFAVPIRHVVVDLEAEHEHVAD